MLLPVSRAIQLTPFVDVLASAGAPVNAGLHKQGLDIDVLYEPDALIGTLALGEFIDDMARREGIADLGWRAGAGGLTMITPALQHSIEGSPTLLCALETICALANRESSNLSLWITPTKNSVDFCHQGSLASGLPGADRLSEMRTLTLVSVVRHFTASDWFPNDCGVVSDADIPGWVRDTLPRTRFQRAPTFGWIRIPGRLLAAPAQASVGRSRPANERPLPADLPSALAAILPACLPHATYSLGRVARLAGCSARSMQRELERHGTSYGQVLQRTKLEVARRLLAQPDLMITDIAGQTGFSDSAHFDRFFKKMTGVTPRQYRLAATGAN